MPFDIETFCSMNFPLLASVKAKTLPEVIPMPKSLSYQIAKNLTFANGYFWPF